MEYIPPIIPIIILISALDYILIAFFNPFIYRFGIPIFKKSKKLKNVSELNLNIQDIEILTESPFTSSIKIKKISKNEYALREKLFQLKLLDYAPVMHGHLIFKNQNITLIGRLNWGLIPFSLLLLGMPLIFDNAKINIIFPIFILLILGLMYLFQSLKYRKLFEYIMNDINRKKSQI